MVNFYKQFCSEGFDENNCLNSFSVRCPDNFNFGYDVVDVIAKQEPEKLALQWCNKRGDEKAFTFGQLSKLSNKAANVFLSHGIGKGDRVMLILKRHYEYWYIINALHKIGAVAIPATNMLTVKDMIYRIKAADIKSVVCTNEGHVADFLLEAQRECPDILKTLFIVRQNKNGFINMSEQTDDASDVLDRIETKSTDPMIIYFTSGTTGEPKAVIHNHTYPLAHIITAKHWHNVKEGGLHLTVAETGWGKASWGKIYGQWLCGSAVMVYDFDKFDADELLAVIKKYKVTTFCAPPTIYRFLIRTDLSADDFGSVEYATTAGEALNYEVFRIFLEKTGLSIMEGFGQTETTLVLANLVNSTDRPGSMGKPSPLYKTALVDENDEFITDSRTGELVILKPENGEQIGLFCGYINDDEQYNYVWRNGMYHTGDTAYRDEDGYYWYVGRRDDIIKSSGYRIGPFEIESVLMQHPSVMEVAVTGVPSEIRGQVVKATIILNKGYEASDELKKELQEYVKHETAPYKYPRIIEFVDSLPKTISGKIQREMIRRADIEKYSTVNI